MVFSDTSTKLGLIQDCEQLLFGNYAEISGNPNRLYDFTARLNRAYDKAASFIMGVDGRWEWDDSNHTDLPVGRTHLVSGQQDYTMDVEHLSVSKLLIKDPAGNTIVLTPIDADDPIASVYLQTTTTPETGTPRFYDKKGSSYLLYPTPNYASTNGLIVHFQRKPSYFAYTDTTKAAGIPAIFHRFLSLDASLDYAISKQLPIATNLATRLKELTDNMTEFYSKRSKDEPKTLRPVFRSSR